MKKTEKKMTIKEKALDLAIQLNDHDLVDYIESGKYGRLTNLIRRIPAMEEAVAKLKNK